MLGHAGVSDHFVVFCACDEPPSGCEPRTLVRRLVHGSGAGQKEFDLERPTRLKRHVDRHFGERTARAVRDLEPGVIAGRLVRGLEPAANDVAKVCPPIRDVASDSSERGLSV